MFRPPALFACKGFLALGIALRCFVAFADTPASSVTTTVVNPGQTYPEVATNSEAWFDVGGFCKVVDVGGLTWANPPASGVPVFIPGPAAQWENYRTLAPNAYHGDLVLTTCCRPQSNIATLCTKAGATPVAVSRQYGKLGEVDTVTATCVDQWGKPYIDAVNVTCSGDNGPDGQAQWIETGNDATSSCTPNANVVYGACSATCGGGNLYMTVQNSCGTVTSQGYNGPSCNTQSCCTPSYSCGGCNQTTGEKTCTDTACGTGSYQSACTQVCGGGSIGNPGAPYTVDSGTETCNYENADFTTYGVYVGPCTGTPNGICYTQTCTPDAGGPPQTKSVCPFDNYVCTGCEYE